MSLLSSINHACKYEYLSLPCLPMSKLFTDELYNTVNSHIYFSYCPALLSAAVINTMTESMVQYGSILKGGLADLHVPRHRKKLGQGSKMPRRTQAVAFEKHCLLAFYSWPCGFAFS